MKPTQPEPVDITYWCGLWTRRRAQRLTQAIQADMRRDRARLRALLLARTIWRSK